jgi:SCY1-like protein 2
VQLNLDYSSPDFVIDSNISSAADMFSMGLLIVALFNSPHTSPLQTNSSVSAYKRLFNSPSTTPSPGNRFLSSRPLPKELASSVLPRLLARRAAQRLTAREFQESQYFDNILVSTIRFLESLPAKSPNEKSQFMRGLARVLAQFPRSVLEKKLLPALLEEMKDRDLLALILQNVFRIVKLLPAGRHAFSSKVAPKLREVFLTTGAAPSTVKGVAPERDLGKEAGLMTILQNVGTITELCSGKEFKDGMGPRLAHKPAAPFFYSFFFFDASS